MTGLEGPGAPPPAGKERRDRLGVVTDEAARTELTMSLDELAREGARRMLAAALEAEVDVYLAAFAELVDGRGHRLAAVSLRSATPSTSLLPRHPSYWTHIPPKSAAREGPTRLSPCSAGCLRWSGPPPGQLRAAYAHQVLAHSI